MAANRERKQLVVLSLQESERALEGMERAGIAVCWSAKLSRVFAEHIIGAIYEVAKAPRVIAGMQIPSTVVRVLLRMVRKIGILGEADPARRWSPGGGAGPLRPL